MTLPDTCKRTTVVGVREPAADAQTIRPDARSAVRRRRRLDQETGRRPDAREGGGETDPRLPQARARLARQQQVAGGPGRRRPGGAFVPDAPEPDRPDRLHAAASEGLATCCHGEEPHTVGWRFINERRAINLDPNCGWARGKADVLYVADAFAVMAKVNELLAAK